MYFTDHPPAHFHARYGEYEAQIEVATGRILTGSLPRRARNLVEEWASLHRAELEANWLRASQEDSLATIEPLP